MLQVALAVGLDQEIILEEAPCILKQHQLREGTTTG
jgi:hypothetical protein